MIRLKYPIIHDAVQHIGSLQIRNVATIGGNLANAVPSADGAIPLIALDARVKDLRHHRGAQRGSDSFLRRPWTNRTQPRRDPHRNRCPQAAGSNRRRLPKIRPPGSYGAFPHCVGVLLSLEEGSSRCTKARVALGVAAPTPIRTLSAERYLVGKEITEETLAEAGKLAAEESRVRDSVRGLAWYRRDMVAVFVRRMA